MLEAQFAHGSAEGGEAPLPLNDHCHRDASLVLWGDDDARGVHARLLHALQKQVAEVIVSYLGNERHPEAEARGGAGHVGRGPADSDGHVAGHFLAIEDGHALQAGEDHVNIQVADDY